MNSKLNCLFIVVCSKYTGNAGIEISNINTVCVLREYFTHNYTLISSHLASTINLYKINLQ
ncbi:hypothetical protein DXD68_21300 [Parabacteroides sp. TM07-1AC]|nr:hypothetical protein DXD68_21300 [Parabacteroides sp. TM07-1AC]